MIPLIIFWIRWVREAVLECGFDVRKWFSRLVGTNILMDFATAAPIEMATLLWLGLTALCVMFDRWPLLRGRKRRFEPFAFLTLLALAEELYLRIWHKQYFTSLPWKGAVAYVSSNHFLFGLHSILGRGVTDGSPEAVRRVQRFVNNELEHVAAKTRLRHKASLKREKVNVTGELAGVGCYLMEQSQERFGIMGAIWSFNEHRLSDVWVHFGVVLQAPYRVDHWFGLLAHLWKYAGFKIPYPFSRPTFNGSISLDNLIDVFAHSLSGLLILGPGWFTLSVIAAELQRWLLDAEVARHHIAERTEPAVCTCQKAEAMSTPTPGESSKKEL